MSREITFLHVLQRLFQHLNLNHSSWWTVHWSFTLSLCYWSFFRKNDKHPIYNARQAKLLIKSNACEFCNNVIRDVPYTARGDNFSFLTAYLSKESTLTVIISRFYFSSFLPWRGSTVHQVSPSTSLISCHCNNSSEMSWNSETSLQMLITTLLFNIS